MDENVIQIFLKEEDDNLLFYLIRLRLHKSIDFCLLINADIYIKLENVE